MSEEFVATDVDPAWIDPEGDISEPTPFGIEPSRVRQVMAGITVALVALVALVISIEPVTRFAVQLAGVVVGLALASAAVAALRARPVRWGRVVASVALLIGLAALVASSTHVLSESTARWTGGILIVTACVSSLIQRRNSSSENAGLSLSLALAGLALLVAPAALAKIVVLLGAGIVFVSVVSRLTSRAGLLDLGDEDLGAPLIVRWLSYNGRTNTAREVIVSEFYFEGPEAAGRLLRFLVLMALASSIATMGVITDSTAVVIGAMLVAPLITPMMGMGLAMAIGWPRRLAQSGFVVLAGVLVAIASGAVLPAALGSSIDLSANSQVLSRSSPTVADLIIAVIAGATGAYANARRDVASSLPGVAIAIALVPPLAIIGVTAQRGAWDQAAGTLLLFLTNLTAILLVGGLVFLITGVAPLYAVARNSHRVRTASAAVAFLAVLVVGALLLNGHSIARDSLAQDDVERIVSDWLGDDSEFSTLSVDVTDDRATVVLAGPGDPPQIEALVSAIAERFERQMLVDVQWVARQRQVSSTADN